MKIEYDHETDSLYIKFKESKVARTLKRSGRLNIDIDLNDGIIGLELLGVSTMSRSFLDNLPTRGTPRLHLEVSIHGRKISRTEALKGLGDPRTWSRDKKKVMTEFRKKPRVRTRRSPTSEDSWRQGKSLVLCPQ